MKSRRFFAALWISCLCACLGAASPRVRMVWQVQAHSNGVSDLALGPDGMLASAGWDGTVRLWDRQGKPGRMLRLGAPVHKVRLSRDRIGCQVGEKETCLFSLEGKLLRRLPFSAAAFSPDLRLVAGGGGVYSSESGKKIRSLAGPDSAGMSIACMAIRPDGQRLLLGGSVYNPAAPGLPDDSYAWEVDLKNGRRSPGRATGEFGTRLAGYAPDGRQMLAGRRHPDSDTAGWLQLSPAVKGIPEAWPGEIRKVAFSWDSRRMAVLEKETSVWDLATGTRLCSLGMGSSAVALGGDFVVTGDSQGKLQMWDWSP